MGIEFLGTEDHLDDIILDLQAVDDAWVLAVRLTAYGEGLKLPVIPGATARNMRRLVPRPANVRVTKRSPLLVELLGDVAGFGTVASATAFGFFVVIVRHSEHITRFIPRQIAAWNREWGEAEMARRDRLIARHLRQEAEERWGEGSLNEESSMTRGDIWGSLAYDVQQSLDGSKPRVSTSGDLRLPKDFDN